MRSQRHAVRASLPYHLTSHRCIHHDRFFYHRTPRTAASLSPGSPLYVPHLAPPPFHIHHDHPSLTRQCRRPSALRLPPLAVQDEIRPTPVPPQQYVRPLPTSQSVSSSLITPTLTHSKPTFVVISLPGRHRLHIDSAHTRRRSDHVRTSVRTLESRPERRKGPSERYIHACRYASPP